MTNSFDNMKTNRHEVYIGIGSNMGSRIRYLDAAVQALQRLSCSSLKCSPVYETKPMDYLAQSHFLNMVVCMQTDLSALDLLDKLHKIEEINGRERHIRFGPRTLDLDILLYDNLYICYKDLHIPHPRMWERSFVMIPLATLIPNRLGLGGRTFIQFAKVHQEGDVRYVGRFW